MGIRNPWYYNGNVVRDIKRWVENKESGGIWVDVDGVIIHSCQAICDMINEKQGTNFTGDEVLSWNFKEICPNLSSEDVEDIFADPTFFQHVQWIDGALDFLKRYEDKITLVTKGTQENIHNKEIFFFDQYKLKVSFIGLTLDQSKGIIDMSDGLFIDDCTYNLNESNAKYKIMFKEYDDDKEREWQKDWNGLVMYKWL